MKVSNKDRLPKDVGETASNTLSQLDVLAAVGKSIENARAEEKRLRETWANTSPTSHSAEAPAGFRWVLSDFRDTFQVASYHRKSGCYDDSGWNSPAAMQPTDRRDGLSRMYSFVATHLAVEVDGVVYAYMDREEGHYRCLVTDTADISLVPEDALPALTINDLLVAQTASR